MEKIKTVNSYNTCFFLLHSHFNAEYTKKAISSPMSNTKAPFAQSSCQPNNIMIHQIIISLHIFGMWQTCKSIIDRHAWHECSVQQHTQVFMCKINEYSFTPLAQSEIFAIGNSYMITVKWKKLYTCANH